MLFGNVISVVTSLEMVALVRIKDIAERAGVSTTTVSNVIHQKEGKVSPEVAAKIKAMIQEMGYVPSLSARMLAREHSHIIGVVVGYSAGAVLLSRKELLAINLVGYLEEVIHEKGYYMMLFTRRSVDEVLEESRAWNFDGIITFGVTKTEVEHLRANFPKPVVIIDSCLDQNFSNVFQVGSDDFGGGQQIGRYLLEQGHRKLLFVADNDVGVDHGRWLGFRKAMEEAGLTGVEQMHLLVSPDRETRLREYDGLLPLFRQQTALCFCSDYHAVEAMNCLRGLGLRTPEDLSITGFDDVVYAWVSWPNLTTVHQCLDEKARIAVEALDNMVSGVSLDHYNQKVATYVVERDSVRPV